MADTLLDAHQAAQTARAAGQTALAEQTLARTRRWYRGAVAKGLTDNQDRRGGLAHDARTLARPAASATTRT
jgi:transposase